MPFMKDVALPFTSAGRKPTGIMQAIQSAAAVKKTGGGMWPGLAGRLIRPGIGIVPSLSKRFGIYGDDSVPDLLAAPVDTSGVPEFLRAPSSGPDIVPSLTTQFAPTTIAAPTTTGATPTSQPSLLNRLLVATVDTAKYLTQPHTTQAKLPPTKSSNSSTLMLLAGVGLVAVLVLSRRK